MYLCNVFPILYIIYQKNQFVIYDVLSPLWGHSGEHNKVTSLWRNQIQYGG